MALELVISVVGKASEFLVEPIWRRACYPFKCKDNIRKLEKEVETLSLTKDVIMHRVKEARRDGQEVEGLVEYWLKRVDHISREADKVLGDQQKANNTCFSISFCPDLKTRYQISRNAEEQIQNCLQLLEEGRFERVSYRPTPQGSIVRPVKGYGDFESRRSIQVGILEALKDPKVSLIGLWGMGGVGKTTIVKKIAAQVKEKGLFKTVVLAMVTQDPDYKRIQGEIADALDFNFSSVETIARRANRLSKRFQQEGSILIVLDDIWKRIDLGEQLGILYGNDHKGCKVLMTSRYLNVLSCEMFTEKNFRLQVLEDEEASDLFEKTVGVAKDSRLQSIAPQVCKRCGGLPILLVTVAKALRDKDVHAWKDSLTWLKRFDNDETDGRKVFSALELSYNFLRDEELKSLFLLCGQHQPSSIPVQDLLMHTFGMGMFKGRNTVEDTRNRLYTLLSELVSSSLLLEVSDIYNAKTAKMHDVVHSFAISVGTRDHYLIRPEPNSTLTKWPDQDMLGKCSAIVLSYNKMPQLQEVLECPNLFVISSRK